MVNMTFTSPAPFAVYVHWPFCLSKCPYCDFNSHVRHGGVDEERFVRAMQAEIAATAARARPNNAARILSPRSALPGPMATWKNSKDASMAWRFGRRAAIKASATTRCFCPTDRTAPSGR